MSNKTIKGFIVIFAVWAASTSFAVETKMVGDNVFSDFNDGITTGVVISDRGDLSFGGTLNFIDSTTASMTWSLVAAPDGKTAWLATGNDGKIMQLKDNKLSCTLEFNDIHPTALLWDQEQKALLIGTAPSGQIFKVDEGKTTATLWFDTKENYVWDMVKDKNNNVYAATGTDGKIYKIEKQETGKLFTKLDNGKNILHLEFFGNDLYASTQNKAYLYKIDSDGNNRVVYSSKDDEEIRTFSFDKAGNVYAAVNSTKTSGESSPATKPSDMLQSLTKITGAIPIEIKTLSEDIGSSNRQTTSTNRPAGKSFVVKITPDGFFKKLWTATDAPIYDMTFANDHDLLVACGNKGKLYCLDTDGNSSRIGQVSEKSITKFANNKNNDILFATNNKVTIGKYVLPTDAKTCEFQSRVLSADQSVRWGNLQISTVTPFKDGKALSVELRHGNSAMPENGGWSEWKPLKRIESENDVKLSFDTERPVAQYVQYRLTLAKTEPSFPKIDSVMLFNVQNNIAPVITAINFPQLGSAPKPPVSSPASDKSLESLLNKISGDSNKSTDSAKTSHSSPTTPVSVASNKPTKTFDITWNASDPNGDKLRYDLAYKAEDESQWRQIDDHILDPKATLLVDFVPDGIYRFKLDAFDDRSNSYDTALSASLVSKAVTFDKTPPVIADLKAERIGQKNEWTVTTSVTDALSNISSFEVSTDDHDDPEFILPTDGLFDGRKKEFAFRVVPTAKFTNTEYIVTVRATDQQGNQSMSKIVLEIKK